MNEKPVRLILLNMFFIIMSIMVLVIIALYMIDTFISWDTSRILLVASMHGVIFVLLLGIWMIYKFTKTKEAKE
jgi:uncharacterized BrkB/YihY/UPF0761 family membrane protein